MTAIELRDVVKTFGAVRALDGLDLVVEPGEVHAFLGPNGAGRSTTIRVLPGRAARRLRQRTPARRRPVAPGARAAPADGLRAG
ncbi:hypothetical protein GCM10023226_41480 [Nocardioides nanhaiensis]|uniref:ABC transporter domain-containing protein n=1 Tax=Nocardioides nanhaiensis TaxID=1476871 RepID=A0ABP8X0B8_9ACTN